MRKRLLSLFLVLLIVLASGCIGASNSTSTTPSQSTASSTASNSTQIETKTTTTTSQNPLETLKSSLESVKQFTYRGKRDIYMNVTVLMSNFTQNNTIALSMTESGYIDFSSVEAMINTTTVTEPDNTTLKIIKIIKAGKVYLKTMVGSKVSSMNVTNSTPDFIWNYNPLSLAKKYLNNTPDKTIKSGSSVRLIYTLNWQDIRALAIPYLAVTKDTGIKVNGGNLTLTFSDGKLTEVEVKYSVIATSIVKDSLLGQMTIKISAKGISDYEITSINEKREVEPPT